MSNTSLLTKKLCIKAGSVLNTPTASSELGWYIRMKHSHTIIQSYVVKDLFPQLCIIGTIYGLYKYIQDHQKLYQCISVVQSLGQTTR